MIHWISCKAFPRIVTLRLTGCSFEFVQVATKLIIELPKAHLYKMNRIKISRIEAINSMNIVDFAVNFP